MEHVALLLQTEVLSSFAPLLLSHEVFFFTSAEMIASRRHITPENCRHKAFFAKVLDAKKGIFCKNPSIVARYFLNVWMSKKFVKCCTLGEKVWKWLLTFWQKFVNCKIHKNRINLTSYFQTVISLEKFVKLQHLKNSGKPS